MFSAQFHELHRYPERWWAKAISDRWVFLCNGLRDYEAPGRCFAVNRERKWELVLPRGQALISSPLSFIALISRPLHNTDDSIPP